MKKLFAFDYDGVLADSQQVNINMMNTILLELNNKFHIEKKHFENLAEISFESVAALASLNKNELSKFMQRVSEENSGVGRECSLFDGIPSLLKKLSEVAIVTVVSNNHSKIAKEVLDREGLSNHFSEITGLDSGKNKSERLTEMMQNNSIKPENCYMIGDGVNDIESAKNAGCKSIAVAWGFQSLNRLNEVNPDFSVNSVKEILEFI
jgi:phosphoglycolate phosphatase